jgi:hypothetical protein
MVPSLSPHLGIPLMHDHIGHGAARLGLPLLLEQQLLLRLLVVVELPVRLLHLHLTVHDGLTQLRLLLSTSPPNTHPAARHQGARLQ